MDEKNDYLMYDLSFFFESRTEEEVDEDFILGSFKKSYYYYMKFLYENKLINIDPLDKNGHLKLDLILNFSNFTKEGILLETKYLDKWYRALDRGVPYEDISILEKGLAKIKAGDDNKKVTSPTKKRKKKEKLNLILNEFVEVMNMFAENSVELSFNDEINFKEENLDAIYELLNFKDYLYISGELDFFIIPKIFFTELNVKYSKYNEWDKNWLVFGRVANGEDLIYVDTSNKKNSVYGYIDEDVYLHIGTSINSFFKVITEILKLEINKYNYKIVDKENMTLKDFTNDVYNLLLELENNKIANNFMNFFYPEFEAE